MDLSSPCPIASVDGFSDIGAADTLALTREVSEWLTAVPAPVIGVPMADPASLAVIRGRKRLRLVAMRRSGR